MNYKIYLFFSLLNLCFLGNIFAQNPTDSTQIDDLEILKKLKANEKPSELQELLNNKIEVASKKPLSSRDSPNILTVITAEEISNSGARDLIDILRQVPGFDLATDVDFVIGLGVRGNWNGGGKVAIFIDGIEQTDILYQTFAFGNHVPVDQIRQIEIIRGAGSAVYGGNAAMGVINILTKNIEETKTHASVNTGVQNQNFGRANATVFFGKKFKNGHISAYTAVGSANKSNQFFTDYVLATNDSTTFLQTDTFDLSKNKNSNSQNFQFNLAGNYKNTSFRFFVDQYKTSTPQFKVNFQNIAFEIKHEFKINDRWKITPKLTYYSQKPWNYAENRRDIQGQIPYVYEVDDNRTRFNVVSSYDPANTKMNFIVGAEYWYDQANDRLGQRYKGSNATNYHNIAFFTQAFWRTRIVNLTLGARFDNNSAFGSAFVPRVGFTKRFNDLHFKLLASRAFRAPGIENIALAKNGIKPEITNVYELEIGYQFTADMLWATNIFYINTEKPIIFIVANQNEDGSYQNFGQTGSWGMETEYKIRQKWGYINLNYSYYQRLQGSSVGTYNVAEQSNLFVAFPNHKISLNGHVKLTQRLGLSPSANYFSERYGYTHINSQTQEWVLGKYDPYFLANLSLNYQNFLFDGLNLSLTVTDIFNQKPMLFQAYQGGYAPIPSPSREFLLKLTYHLDQK